jgi:hypothetical protein
MISISAPIWIIHLCSNIKWLARTHRLIGKTGYIRTLIQHLIFSSSQSITHYSLVTTFSTLHFIVHLKTTQPTSRGAHSMATLSDRLTWRALLARSARYLTGLEPAVRLCIATVRLRDTLGLRGEWYGAIIGRQLINLDYPPIYA